MKHISAADVKALKGWCAVGLCCRSTGLNWYYLYKDGKDNFCLSTVQFARMDSGQGQFTADEAQEG